MKEETTKAGRLYGVCSAGECIVTDAETGLVLATLDGSKQEAFIAPGSQVYLSDDAAVVTELFKLAPCRGAVAKLLLRKAGGLLPRGFTELEYLESSGTQYIDTGIATDGTYTISSTLRGNNVGGNNDIWGRRSTGGESFVRRFKATYWLISFYYAWAGQLSEPQLNSAQVHDYIVTEGKKNIVVDGKNFNLNALNTNIVNASNPDSKTHYLFAANTPNSVPGQVCFYSFRMQDGEGNVVLDFIPALRKSDGVPGMWDRVSKQFFVNLGTGSFGYRIKRSGETSAPMSLRDPWRVAPSGVYARKVGEAELEVLADTEETTGEGWEWFANTGEAYEHFGITQEEFLTE